MHKPAAAAAGVPGSRRWRRTQEADPSGPTGTVDQFRRDWGLLAFEALMYAVREDPEMLQGIAERYRQIDRMHAERLEPTDEGAEAIPELAIA